LLFERIFFSIDLFQATPEQEIYSLECHLVRLIGLT
jgi:hypothetical protein